MRLVFSFASTSIASIVEVLTGSSSTVFFDFFTKYLSILLPDCVLFFFLSFLFASLSASKFAKLCWWLAELK